MGVGLGALLTQSSFSRQGKCGPKRTQAWPPPLPSSWAARPPPPGKQRPPKRVSSMEHLRREGRQTGENKDVKGIGSPPEAQERAPLTPRPKIPAGMPPGWGQEGAWGEECSLSQPRSRPFFWVLRSPRADLPSLTLWRGEWGAGQRHGGALGPLGVRTFIGVP